MKQIEVPIKPLSTNQMYKGRKHKTHKYDQFDRDLRTYLLVAPKLEIPKTGALEIHFVFGLSNYQQSDYDNCIKAAQDVLCNFYNINDNRFAAGSQRKTRVPKGKEFIRFLIKQHNPHNWGGI